MAKGDSRNHATRRRQERQEALLEYLSEHNRLEYILENIIKMEKEGGALDPQAFQGIKAANDQRIKLLDKYLPALKSSDVDLNLGMQDSFSKFLLEINNTLEPNDSED